MPPQMTHGQQPASREETEESSSYRVVVNPEGTYSIWPSDRDPPLGWKETGKTGTKRECLGYIEEIWTDMRAPAARRQGGEDR